MWNAVKAMLRKKFIALNAYIRKEERNQINELNFYLKKLQERRVIKPKIGIRKETIKIRVAINQIENSKTFESQ